MASTVRSTCASAAVVASVQRSIRITGKVRGPGRTTHPKYQERLLKFKEREEAQIQWMWIRAAMEHQDMPCIRELLAKGYGEDHDVLSMAVQTLNLQVVQACRELRPEALSWYSVHVNQHTSNSRTEADILNDLRCAHEIIHSLYNESPRVLPTLECPIDKFGLQCRAALRFINRQEELPMITDFLRWLRNSCMKERGRAVFLNCILKNCIRESYPVEALDWLLVLFPKSRPADETWYSLDCRDVYAPGIRRHYMSQVTDPTLHAQYDAWLTQHFPE